MDSEVSFNKLKYNVDRLLSITIFFVGRSIHRVAATCRVGSVYLALSLENFFSGGCRLEARRCDFCHSGWYTYESAKEIVGGSTVKLKK